MPTEYTPYCTVGNDASPSPFQVVDVRGRGGGAVGSMAERVAVHGLLRLVGPRGKESRRSRLCGSLQERC